LLLRTGRKEHELRKVPIEDGQLFHLLFREERRDIGAIGLQLRSFAGDLNHFGRAAQLHGGIHVAGDVGGNSDRLLFRFLEALGFDRYVVSAGNEVIDVVIPRLIRGDSLRRALLDGGDRHFCIRNSGTRRVRDRSENTAVNRLGGSILRNE
jgi:hypothetical protein